MYIRIRKKLCVQNATMQNNLNFHKCDPPFSETLGNAGIKVLFLQQLYKQLIGAAMGGKPIPDKQIMQVTDGLFPDENKIKFFKRFLDDIFLIFRGNCKELHLWLDVINSIHSSIKFTINHTIKTKCDHCDDDAKEKI